MLPDQDARDTPEKLPSETCLPSYHFLAYKMKLDYKRLPSFVLVTAKANGTYPQTAGAQNTNSFRNGISQRPSAIPDVH